MKTDSPKKNPARVAAAKLNRAKRKGLTDAGRQKLRETALKSRLWEHSTGPRTAAGKEKSALNGLKKQKVPGPSVRQLRRELAGADSVMNQLAELRKMLAS